MNLTRSVGASQVTRHTSFVPDYLAVECVASSNFVENKKGMQNEQNDDTLGRDVEGQENKLGELKIQRCVSGVEWRKT